VQRISDPLNIRVLASAVGVVAQAAECREQADSHARLMPFTEAKIARNGVRGLVAFGDEIVEIFISRRLQWLECVTKPTFAMTESCRPSD
jgi:hypothetical protein